MPRQTWMNRSVKLTGNPGNPPETRAAFRRAAHFRRPSSLRVSAGSRAFSMSFLVADACSTAKFLARFSTDFQGVFHLFPAILRFALYSRRSASGALNLSCPGQASLSAAGQFARVVKGVDLRSTARKCAWARTP